MLVPKKQPRPVCARCLRPMPQCLCAHVPRLSNLTRVLILQHPDEAKHPLNTARLAAMGLQSAELLIGEYFPQLAGAIASVESAFLLFPAKSEDVSQLPSMPRPEEPSLLIVPDGTWRKARKIIHANPVLGTLPRLSLPPGEPSEYRIRKAREPAAVSTIEAIVRSLSLLEPERDFQPLLKPFRVLVEQQVRAMGEEVYRRNYQGRTCSDPERAKT